MRRTWAPKGQTPIIASAGSWKNMSLLATITCTSRARSPKLFLKSNPGSVNASVVFKYLRDLKKHINGKRLLLFWDGLPAHRAKIVNAFLKENRMWLRVVRMPAYAPELNPPEYLWAAMKARDLVNLRPDGLSSCRRAIRRSSRRIKRRPDLLVGFLKASKLF